MDYDYFINNLNKEEYVRIFDLIGFSSKYKEQKFSDKRAEKNFVLHEIEIFAKTKTNLYDENGNISELFKKIHGNKFLSNYLNNFVKICFEKNIETYLHSDLPFNAISIKSHEYALNESKKFKNDIFDKAKESNILVSYDLLVQNYKEFQKDLIKEIAMNDKLPENLRNDFGYGKNIGKTFSQKNYGKYNEELFSGDIFDDENIMVDSLSEDDIKLLDNL